VVRIAGENIWYVSPVRALAGRLTINLYPFGCRKDGRNSFEKYRGAWGLLRGKKVGREKQVPLLASLGIGMTRVGDASGSE